MPQTVRFRDPSDPSATSAVLISTPECCRSVPLASGGVEPEPPVSPQKPVRRAAGLRMYSDGYTMPS